MSMVYLLSHCETSGLDLTFLLKKCSLFPRVFATCSCIMKQIYTKQVAQSPNSRKTSKMSLKKANAPNKKQKNHLISLKSQQCLIQTFNLIPCKENTLGYGSKIKALGTHRFWQTFSLFPIYFFLGARYFWLTAKH